MLEYAYDDDDDDDDDDVFPVPCQRVHRVFRVVMHDSRISTRKHAPYLQENFVQPL